MKYIYFSDFLDNVKYKEKELIIFMDKTLSKQTYFIEIFPVLYPQYKEDILYMKKYNNLTLENTYKFLKYISNKNRKMLYQFDNFYKYLPNIFFDDKEIINFKKYIEINSLKEEYLLSMNYKNFHFFLSNIYYYLDNKVFNIPFKFSLTDLIYVYQISEDNQLLFIYYYLSLVEQKIPKQKIFSNLNLLKMFPLKDLNIDEVVCFVSLLKDKNVLEYKKIFNPLNIQNNIAYLMYLYIYSLKDINDEKNKHNDLIFKYTNDLSEEDILLTTYNVLNKYKYEKKDLYKLKEIDFLINVLKIDINYIYENLSYFLELLISKKLLSMYQLYYVYNSKQKERYIYIIKKILLKEKLDEQIEFSIFCNYLNIEKDIFLYKNFEKKLTIITSNYSFIEEVNLMNLFDGGKKPIRTCLDWEDGDFKHCLMSIFSPTIKFIKIYKNNKCIGRTLLSITKNENNKLCLMIHSIYIHNSTTKEQKEIGKILLNSLKDLSKKINADILLYIGRKRNLKNKIIINEKDLELINYNVYVLKNIFPQYFDPDSSHFCIDKNVLTTLKFDQIWTTEN